MRAIEIASSDRLPTSRGLPELPKFTDCRSPSRADSPSMGRVTNRHIADRWWPSWGGHVPICPLMAHVPLCPLMVMHLCAAVSALEAQQVENQQHSLSHYERSRTTVITCLEPISIRRLKVLLSIEVFPRVCQPNFLSVYVGGEEPNIRSLAQTS